MNKGIRTEKKLKHHKMNAKRNPSKMNWLEKSDKKKTISFYGEIYTIILVVFSLLALAFDIDHQSDAIQNASPSYSIYRLSCTAAWEILMKCQPCVEYDENVHRWTFLSILNFSLRLRDCRSLLLCNFIARAPNQLFVHCHANELQSDISSSLLIGFISFIHVTSESKQ